MLAGLDSAYPPSASSIAQAYAAGVRLWAGYFAGPNILNGWTQDDFARVKAGGMATIAFCSGWSDPSAMKAQSAAWGVPICLDVESGIRAFMLHYLTIPSMRNGIKRRFAGAWVQPWLSTSGAGLYGNPPVHPGITAAFHVLAAYPGYNPQATWYGTSPGTLCGWQWQGSHAAFGVTVDSAWYDDGFQGVYGPGSSTIGGFLMSLTDAQQTELYNGIKAINYALLYGRGTPNVDPSGYASVDLDQRLDAAMKPVLDAVKAILAPPTVSLQPILDAIVAVKTEVDVLKPTTSVDLSSLEASLTAIQTAVVSLAAERTARQTLEKVKTDLV